MSKVQYGHPGRPSSEVESAVLDALAMLPQPYSVTVAPRGLMVNGAAKDGWMEKFSPDFEIVDEDGARLIIEVKSSHSMSLANMLKFSEINSYFSEDPKTHFLVLVWGQEWSKSRLIDMPAFDGLRLQYVTQTSDVLRVVEEEFRSIRQHKH